MDSEKVRNEEEWKEVRLGEIFEIIGGGTPKTRIE